MINISVIIPIYNTAEYIETCAVSLFEQTIKDIEYIFINDCTQDNSIEILQEVLKKYPNRISQTRIVNMQTNSGVAAVRKYGISIATGEYIANCDSDDYVSRDMYKTMYEYAHLNNSDIVRCKFARCYKGSYVECYNIPSENYNDKQKYISCLLSEYDLNSLCDKIIRKSLFLDNEIIYPKHHMYEDNVLNIQLAYYSNIIGYVDKIMYYYSMNPNSICNQTDEKKLQDRMMQKKANVDIITQFLKRKGIYELFIKEVTGLKYNVREDIQHLIHKKSMFEVWNKIYPEIKLKYLPNNKLKIKFILNKIRLPYIIQIYRYLRRPQWE